MPNFSSKEMEILRKPAFPSSAVLAAYMYQHPWQQVFIPSGSKVTWFFYHPIDQCFYCRTPDNKVRNDWQRARGMDGFLATAQKYFDVLFEEVSSGD